MPIYGTYYLKGKGKQMVVLSFGRILFVRYLRVKIKITSQINHCEDAIINMWHIFLKKTKIKCPRAMTTTGIA